MGRGGVLSLRGGSLISGILACVYNGYLIYWFVTALQDVPTSSEIALVLQTLIEVLMSLAAAHVFVSVLLIYGVMKGKPDLVMLWVVVYISSCIIVSSLFTIGLAFLMKKRFLYIVLCNCLFIFGVIINLRLYNKMILNLKTESV